MRRRRWRTRKFKVFSVKSAREGAQVRECERQISELRCELLTDTCLPCLRRSQSCYTSRTIEYFRVGGLTRRLAFFRGEPLRRVAL